MIWTWQSVAPAKLSAALASLIDSPAAEPSARAPNSRRVKPMFFPPSLLAHQQFQRGGQSRGYDHHARHDEDASAEIAGRIPEKPHHIGADKSTRCPDRV